jgi:hypothetical protein
VQVGLNFDDVRMAVLVQRVVPAQYGGWGAAAGRMFFLLGFLFIRVFIYKGFYLQGFLFVRVFKGSAQYGGWGPGQGLLQAGGFKC